MTERSTNASFLFTLLVLTTCCLPPRPVALIRQAALADRLALRWVGDGMVMVAFGCPIRLSPPRFDRLTRRMSRDQAVAPVSDEVSPPRLEQSLPHDEVVLRLEELHQRPLHLPVPQASCDVNLFSRKGIDTRIVKCRGDVTGHPHKAQYIRRSHQEEATVFRRQGVRSE